MNGVKHTVPSSNGWSTLVRPKFGPGMLLQHEDLEQLHGYTRELSRLLFRSFFGCGVVCGLVVKPNEHCGKWRITVGAGLALNCTGDPIYVPKDQNIDIDPHCDPDPDTPLWVILCPSVKCCAPRTSMCPTDDDETSSSCTRERDGFEIRVIKERPRCSCGCLEPEGENGHDHGGHGNGGNGGNGGNNEHDSECWCVDPMDPCYHDHYLGKCGCTCIDCAGGGCDCVLLARLDFTDDPREWTADHSVRRFIRPVLIRDPQVHQEKEDRAQAQQAAQGRQQAYAVQQAEVRAEKGRTRATKSQKPVQS